MLMKPTIVYLYLFVSFIFGTVTVLYGFFPISFSTDTTANFDEIPKNIDKFGFSQNFYKPRFTKTVLMVIDAIRMDFIESKDSMEHVKKLLSDNKACMYNINVHPPTVTLPRIKSMSSGTIPSFVDVVLNFGSPEMKVDSILRQMQNRGDKMVFYGDNTWSKMFPGKFLRVGETQDSFFVNDFYEGDRNITKHLHNELRRDDWDFLILHYLGLDHIGHVEGPHSSKMPKKLKEMDTVVSEIDRTLTNWNAQSLLLITGDHGMRDSGGHGGSSFSETHVPLVVIGMNCTSSKEIYQQTDFATTTSVLLGLPIPYSSVGSVIPELINDLSYEDQLSIYYYSANRLFKKVNNMFVDDSINSKEFYRQYQNAVNLHIEFLQVIQNKSMISENIYRKAQLSYTSSSREMTHILTKNFLKFDLFIIYTGITMNVLTFFTYILTLCSNINKTQFNIDLSLRRLTGFIATLLILKYCISKLSDCYSMLCENSLLSNFTLAILGIVLHGNAKIIAYVLESWTGELIYIRNTIRNMTFLEYFLLFSIFFHTISYSSSSFIEEEHQTWYYLTDTLFLILFVLELKHLLKTKSKIFYETGIKTVDQQLPELYILKNNSSFFLLWIFFYCSHIFMKRLNQTGDKWLNVPDIGDWLILPENKVWMSLFLAFGLILMIWACCYYSGILTSVLIFAASFLIYYYRTITESVLFPGIQPSTSKTSLAIFWINTIEIICINYIRIIYKLCTSKEFIKHEIKLWLGSNIALFCVVSSLLHKPHNVLLNGACVLTCDVANNLCNKLFKEKTKRNIIKIIAHVWIGKMFYFYQGNANNIAAIDLNAGYVGLDSYNIMCVGIFLTINTYSGVILSFLVLLFNVYDVDNNNIRNKSSDIPLVTPVILFTILTPAVLYVILITAFRHHIFVWTVFSPKMFYEFYHMCLMFVILCLTYLIRIFFNIK